jgi:hypothetical protein
VKFEAINKKTKLAQYMAAYHTINLQFN